MVIHDRLHNKKSCENTTNSHLRTRRNALSPCAGGRRGSRPTGVAIIVSQIHTDCRDPEPSTAIDLALTALLNEQGMARLRRRQRVRDACGTVGGRRGSGASHYPRLRSRLSFTAGAGTDTTFTHVSEDALGIVVCVRAVGKRNNYY